MSGSVGGLFLILVIVLSIFWVLYSAGKYAGFDIGNLLSKSTYTSPAIPVIEWLQGLSAMPITTEIGLIALVFIFIMVIFK